MNPGILYDPLVMDHLTGRHPEHPGRLTAVLDLLRRRGLWEQLKHLDVQLPPRAALEAVHDEEYLEMLEIRAKRGGGYLSGDTPFSAGSWRAVMAATGAAVTAVDAVLSNAVPSAFALVRPPGHHACIAEGMGFCLLNHAAIAARHAIQARGLNRVLLVDFDVHHGNGTQEVFYSDPTVLYFSIHQYPAYPGTGSVQERGADSGYGTTVNVPLPAGVGDAGHLAVLQHILVPIARSYRPELILVSAGYDSHWTNGALLNSIRMNVSVAGFGAWVALLKELSNELCGGKIAFTLEGGYDPNALAWSIDATFRALLGECVDDPVGPSPFPDAMPVEDLISAYCRLFGLD